MFITFMINVQKWVPKMWPFKVKTYIWTITLDKTYPESFLTYVFIPQLLDDSLILYGQYDDVKP